MIRTESGLQFDFDEQCDVRKIDEESPNLNAIDFLIQEQDSQIWLEVKNLRNRLKINQSETTIETKKELNSHLREKFRGTASHLFLRKESAQDIHFVMVLVTDDAQFMTIGDLIKGFKDELSGYPTHVKVDVLTVDQWNKKFPRHPVTVDDQA